MIVSTTQLVGEQEARIREEYAGLQIALLTVTPGAVVWAGDTRPLPLLAVALYDEIVALHHEQTSL